MVEQRRADAVDELLEKLITALDVTNEPGRLLAQIMVQNQGMRDLRAAVLARMKPDEPPKTKETAFGHLTRGDEFLLGGVRYRAVSGGGTYAAVALDGPSRNILHWPGARAKVQKIIE